MAKKLYSHLFLDKFAESIGYKAKGQPSTGPRIPVREDRASHATRLVKQFDVLWQSEKDEKKHLQAQATKFVMAHMLSLLVKLIMIYSPKALKICNKESGY